MPGGRSGCFKEAGHEPELMFNDDAQCTAVVIKLAPSMRREEEKVEYEN
jgi:hypothetical protein